MVKRNSDHTAEWEPGATTAVFSPTVVERQSVSKQTVKKDNRLPVYGLLWHQQSKASIKDSRRTGMMRKGTKA